LAFLDPPKDGVAQAIKELFAAGVDLKIISGDSRAVTVHLAREVGVDTSPGRVLTGSQLDELSDESLWARVERTTIFAEVDPNQKERIILSLKKRGHVVGYMGDGINDAPALHAADVSMSVEGAVDVAREAADFVLVERRLDVLRRGVLEGRTTFANTLKYILTTESANLGNMLSMALCSAFLPFLPLLAGQVLLNNLLSDVPAMALAGDAVDEELIAKPRRWDLRFIRRFMLQFGVLSSVFDFATFGTLLYAFKAGEAEFRTGWFVESVVSASLVVLVVRTRGAAWRSLPARGLVLATVGVCAAAVALPVSPLAAPLGFVPLPARFYPVLAAIVVAYIGSAEAAKRRFYRWASF
jgi:Mg2+-importing ATPase